MINQYRKNIIQLIYEFYISCIKINDVKRIALIGSITTNKQKPHDVDLLLTIPDDLDLTHLAKISRRLQGRSAQIGGGADIFLANLNNEYIGRICSWKICKFGVRLRCDADNCGKREYLHDDLSVVKLSKELIDFPPLILSSNIVQNSSIPLDLEEGLIKKIVSKKI
ncbi:MAG: hypothetical protein AB1695_08285 [Stygiobacter sp.]